MSHALTIVEPATLAPKKKREKICLIETQPEADWFVQAKTKRGRQVWYLRFQMTGWNPRLYGPFKSQRVGLLFLDQVINAILNPMAEVEDYANEWRVQEPCAHSWLPIVDHPVVSQPHQLRRKEHANDRL